MDTNRIKGASETGSTKTDGEDHGSTCLLCYSGAEVRMSEG